MFLGSFGVPGTSLRELAQCTELVQQLRDHAGARQVQDARLALPHNLGLGRACVVTLYERA